MFQKILVATDLSPASDCLLQCVGELKAVGLKKAVLAHVLYVANTPRRYGYVDGTLFRGSGGG